MHEEIQARISLLRGVTQEQIAAACGICPTVFSRYLRGRRVAPAGFVEQVSSELDLLEEAERAANEARSEVLARRSPRQRPTPVHPQGAA